ncbi:MAG TPA: RHS repeat-associated core domain-containing protein, partial [Bacteroidales bacterium]|nr:RHS repeat-associated core domain-containing protein [Bacteroidales bacterium]
MKIHYHSDHLGSASFVTNAEGGVMQHLQYLPYGELFVSQRNSKEFDSRYKFTAKELDNETSYTYFGARYYDSELSVWLSVDPMSDKRRWISPYSYCQNNPIGR